MSVCLSVCLSVAKINAYNLQSAEGAAASHHATFSAMGGAYRPYRFMSRGSTLVT